MPRCEGCGSSDLDHSENALCPLCWAAQFTDDEWDSVVASANTGSSDDYSHLDDDDA